MLNSSDSQRQSATKRGGTRSSLFTITAEGPPSSSSANAMTTANNALFIPPSHAGADTAGGTRREDARLPVVQDSTRRMPPPAKRGLRRTLLSDVGSGVGGGGGGAPSSMISSTSSVNVNDMEGTAGGGGGGMGLRASSPSSGEGHGISEGARRSRLQIADSPPLPTAGLAHPTAQQRSLLESAPVSSTTHLLNQPRQPALSWSDSSPTTSHHRLSPSQTRRSSSHHFAQLEQHQHRTHSASDHTTNSGGDGEGGEEGVDHPHSRAARRKPQRSHHHHHHHPRNHHHIGTPDESSSTTATVSGGGGDRSTIAGEQDDEASSTASKEDDVCWLWGCCGRGNGVASTSSSVSTEARASSQGRHPHRRRHVKNRSSAAVGMLQIVQAPSGGTDENGGTEGRGRGLFVHPQRQHSGGSTDSELSFSDSVASFGSSAQKLHALRYGKGGKWGRDRNPASLRQQFPPNHSQQQAPTNGPSTQGPDKGKEDDGWSRHWFTHCYDDVGREDSFVCYFYEHRSCSVVVWLLVAAGSLPVVVPVLFDKTQRAAALATVGFAAVVWTICWIVMFVNARRARALRQGITMPTFAPVVDSGQWLYVDAPTFSKMVSNAKLHEALLAVMFFFTMVFSLNAMYGRLRFCNHADPFFCLITSGSSASCLLFFAIAVFVAPFRFFLYFAVQSAMLPILLFAQFMPLEITFYQGTFNETLIEENEVATWVQLMKNISLYTIEQKQVTEWRSIVDGVPAAVLLCLVAVVMFIFGAIVRRRDELLRRDRFQRLVALHIACRHQHGLHGVAAGLVGFPMPPSLARRVAAGESVEVFAPNACVAVFGVSDHFRFTGENGPLEIIQRLHGLFGMLDRVKESWPSLVKVHAFGDTYVVVSGLEQYTTGTLTQPVEATPHEDNNSSRTAIALETLNRSSTSVSSVMSNNVFHDQMVISSTQVFHNSTSGANHGLVQKGPEMNNHSNIHSSSSALTGGVDLKEKLSERLKVVNVHDKIVLMILHALSRLCGETRSSLFANELITGSSLVSDWSTLPADIGGEPNTPHQLPGSSGIEIKEDALLSEGEQESADGALRQADERSPSPHTSLQDASIARSTEQKGHSKNTELIHVLRQQLWNPSMPIVVAVTSGPVMSVFSAKRNEYVATGPPVDAARKQVKRAQQNGRKLLSSRGPSAAPSSPPFNATSAMFRGGFMISSEGASEGVSARNVSLHTSSMALPTTTTTAVMRDGTCFPKAVPPRIFFQKSFLSHLSLDMAEAIAEAGGAAGSLESYLPRSVATQASTMFVKYFPEWGKHTATARSSFSHAQEQQRPLLKQPASSVPTAAAAAAPLNSSLKWLVSSCNPSSDREGMTPPCRCCGFQPIGQQQQQGGRSISPRSSSSPTSSSSPVNSSCGSSAFGVPLAGSNAPHRLCDNTGAFFFFSELSPSSNGNNIVDPGDAAKEHLTSGGDEVEAQAGGGGGMDSGVFGSPLMSDMSEVMQNVGEDDDATWIACSVVAFVPSCVGSSKWTLHHEFQSMVADAKKRRPRVSSSSGGAHRSPTTVSAATVPSFVRRGLTTTTTTTTLPRPSSATTTTRYSSSDPSVAPQQLDDTIVLDGDAPTPSSGPPPPPPTASTAAALVSPPGRTTSPAHSGNETIAQQQQLWRPPTIPLGASIECGVAGEGKGDEGTSSSSSPHSNLIHNDLHAPPNDLLARSTTNRYRVLNIATKSRWWSWLGSEFADPALEAAYEAYLAPFRREWPMSVIMTFWMSIMLLVTVIVFMDLQHLEEVRHAAFVHRYDSALYMVASAVPYSHEEFNHIAPIALSLFSLVLAVVLAVILQLCPKRLPPVAFHALFFLQTMIIVGITFFEADHVPTHSEAFLWTSLICLSSLARGPVYHHLWFSLMDAVFLLPFGIRALTVFDKVKVSGSTRRWVASNGALIGILDCLVTRVLLDKLHRGNFVLLHLTEYFHAKLQDDYEAIRGVLEGMIPNPLAVDLMQEVKHRMQRELQLLQLPEKQRIDDYGTEFQLPKGFSFVSARDAPVPLLSHSRQATTGSAFIQSGVGGAGFPVSDAFTRVPSTLLANEEESVNGVIPPRLRGGLLFEHRTSTVLSTGKSGGQLFKGPQLGVRQKNGGWDQAEAEAMPHQGDAFAGDGGQLHDELLPDRGAFFTAKSTVDTPLLIIQLQFPVDAGMRGRGGNNNNVHFANSHRTQTESTLSKRLSLWEEVRRRLPYYRTELLCVKVSGDLCMIAGRHPGYDGTVADLMRLAVWLSMSFVGVAQDRCADVCVRAALVFGPMRGAVLGSSALSYELYGEAASTALALLEEAEMAVPSTCCCQIVVDERFVRHLVREVIPSLCAKGTQQSRSSPSSPESEQKIIQQFFSCNVSPLQRWKIAGRNGVLPVRTIQNLVS